jgi:hypothetical protein
VISLPEVTKEQTGRTALVPLSFPNILSTK